MGGGGKRKNIEAVAQCLPVSSPPHNPLLTSNATLSMYVSPADGSQLKMILKLNSD